MPNIQYKFNTPNNYIYDDSLIEIVNGLAKLKLIEDDVSFIDDFSDVLSVSGDVIVINGNVVSYHYDDVILHSKFVNQLDGNFGIRSTIATIVGGASIIDGKLDLAHNDVRYIKYDPTVLDGLVDLSGCIRLKITPNYSGAPTGSSKCFWGFSVGENNNNGLTGLFHIVNSGVLQFHLRNESGIKIIDFDFGVWNPIAGHEYEFELNYDIVNGETRLFIDGIQFGGMCSSIGNRTVSYGFFAVGYSPYQNKTSNFYIRDFTIFSDVKHRSNYVVGEQLPDINHIDSPFFINYNESIQPNYSVDSVTSNSIGGASVVDGKLDLAHDSLRQVDYIGTNLSIVNGSVGCIKFKVIPNWSGYSSNNRNLFTISRNHNEFHNLLTIYIPANTKQLRLYAGDKNGSLVINPFVFGNFDFVAGQEYEFELDYDFVNGETRLFIDGIQFGGVCNVIVDRTNDINLIRVGGHIHNASYSNFWIDDFIIYKYPKHKNQYIAGFYTLPNKRYVGGRIDCGLINASGQISEITKLLSFNTNHNDICDIRFVVENDSNLYYYDGNNWVNSNGTYDQANVEDDINNNLDSFVFDYNKSFAFVVFFPESNDVCVLNDYYVLYHNIFGYSNQNPTIKPTTAFSTTAILSVLADIVLNDNTNCRFAINVNGQDKYYDGNDWVDSFSINETNDIDTFKDNIIKLNVIGLVYPVIYFVSDGVNYPSILDLIMVSEYYGDEAELVSVCVVYGYVYDVNGNPVSDVSVSAILDESRQYQNKTLTRKKFSATTNSNGYWSIAIVDTDKMSSDAVYFFDFRGENINYTALKRIPDKPYIAFKDL